MKQTVGVVGLGAMGSAIAIRLHAAGHPVVGFDVRSAALDELAQTGGTPAASPRDVGAAADVVILSLPTIGAFRDVLGGPDGVPASGRAGLDIIDTSTMPIAVKEDGAQAAAAAGMTLLDGTVSGNRDMILAGTLTAYYSGARAVYDRWAGMLSTFAGKQRFVGAFGNASKIKFVVNHLVCVLTCANAEAMSLALKAGLAADEVLELVRDSAANSTLWEIRGPMMVSEDYTSSRGNMAMATKDGPVIGAFAESLNHPAPLFQAALQMHHAAVGMDMFDLDSAALCRVYERLSGIAR